MALILNLNPGANDLQVSPATNGIYAQCGQGAITGLLSTNNPSGETINSITINENTITILNLVFDGLPMTFPYTVNFGTNVAVDFQIILTGTIGNADTIEFVFNMQGGATYSFQYDITELDLQDSITIANNTLPLDFGSVDVGNFSNVVFVVNNETCIRYGYEISTDGEITFNGGNTSVNISPFPRTTANVLARWDPTSAYDLSAFQIFADMDCGQATYSLAGISTEPPPPVGGEFYPKLSISNSISI